MNVIRLTGFKLFSFIWFGQLISILGSGLTGFALGVWVFQQTGSVTNFAIIMLTNIIPGIIASPFAGVIVDRFDRRWVMMISDFTAALGTVGVFVLLLSGQLQVWHIYILTAINSTANAFQSPAYQATVSMLVPKQHLGRANGMIQMAEAISVVVAPMLAGLLMYWIGMTFIVMIDFITAAFAITSLILVRFPRIAQDANSASPKKKGTMRQEIAAGWQYIVERPGLKGLLIFFAISNFLLGFANVGLTPLILSFATETDLGMVMSLSGVGMLIGGLMVSIWGGPKKKIRGLLFAGMIHGLINIAFGLKESVILMAILMMFMMVMINIANASSQTIWQSKVAPEVQGRVFALRRMLAVSLSPIAYIISGPIIDRGLEPLMATDGALAGTVGVIIGTGTGRGIALAFMIMGLLLFLNNLISYLNPRIRNIEKEIPDAVVKTESPDQVESEGKVALAEA